MATGTLYGIGVGPGDPEFITLKAVRILNEVDVVFAASSTKNDHSLAKGIVSRHLKNGVPVRILGFPMTRDKEELADAWRKNAAQVMDVLKQGKDAAFITLGDPMTYSTFGYLMKTIRSMSPLVPIEVVPGITSYHAAAAAACRVLAESEESFAVVSGAMGAARLNRMIAHTDNVVMLKVYKNYREILETLQRLEPGAESVLVSQCGLEGEAIVEKLEDWPMTGLPYLTCLIIKKTKDKDR